MPIHDWTRVDAGIFHDFHQEWIREIKHVLNEGLLPEDYYALAELRSAGFEPDVLTLKRGGASGLGEDEEGGGWGPGPGGRRGEHGPAEGMLVAEPQSRIRARSDLEFYRRRQNVVAVRHVVGDRLVAMVEIVSKGNKSSRKALDDFVHKAADFLQHQVHLLIIDIQPTTARDPHGIHGAIWEAATGETYEAPPGEPLTLAAYESDLAIQAFVEPMRLGADLIDMPLFLEPGGHVLVPLEETYQAAFDAVPRRWREVLGPSSEQA
jgi:hypothetical protein